MKPAAKPFKELTHVFVGHGDVPIPPPAWGAVEHIIWQTAIRLRAKGLTVHIVNKRRYAAVLKVLQLSLKGQADIVFCHSEKPVPLLTFLSKWRKFLLISTTHCPLNPLNLGTSQLKALRRCNVAPYHFVGREDIKTMILERNPEAICALQLNAVETQDFHRKQDGNGKAICLGRIQERKRQDDTARLLQGSGIECDFVGPLMEDVPISDELRSRMLGEWDRDTVHKRLCEYSCLILLSHAERQALVVVEALAAGIPVVVSPDAAWNIDTSKPYIFVVESDDQVVQAVKSAIAIRNQYTNEIRQYIAETFDYQVLIDDYLAQVEEWLIPKKVH